MSDVEFPVGKPACRFTSFSGPKWRSGKSPISSSLNEEMLDMTDGVIHRATPEETARLEALARVCEAEKDGLLAQIAREDEAAAEDSLAGELRRAIIASVITANRLARETGIELDAILAFQSGEIDLPLGAFARLANRVGMRLKLEPVGG
jgi:hypothetical protein